MGATVKINNVNKSGVLNMTKDIAPLSNKKGNPFTSKTFLLSLLIRSLPCAQAHGEKGHFFKITSHGINKPLGDADRGNCKQQKKGAKGSFG